jgi:hypothetical protein
VLSDGQSTLPAQQSPDVPVVAMIGEYETAFEMLARENPEILLSVCGNDMDIAYERWMDMLVAMEDYAESIGFDINGVKTYLYIFWSPDGTFRHLAFYPKANSRNVPNEELRAFFKAFAKEYHMPFKTDVGYSHYGSASFPTHARPEYRAKKD